ncbi:hypothetical protein ACIBAG_40790 [Streptomyces sp. NPDC051243]|uniref:hypothetical protein n=1 Tax=Streptomyces sp. NPDC051243 TaxID=3365646 RepID=UPI0037A6D8E8
MNDAESAAAQADRDATEAEKDAAGARSAASTAEADATAADRTATQAESDAVKAEKAASNADSAAKEADAAATRAEEEERERERKAAQALLEENGSGLDWIKANGAEILLEYIGANDIKRCFTEGDVESCLWTVVGAVGVAIPVLKFPAVAKAVVRVATAVQCPPRLWRARPSRAWPRGLPPHRLRRTRSTRVSVRS